MIKLKHHFDDSVVRVYQSNEDGEDTFIGVCNSELSFYDLRLQVKEQKLDNIYFIFNEEKHIIRPNGRVSPWPRGLYVLIENYLQKL